MKNILPILLISFFFSLETLGQNDSSNLHLDTLKSSYLLEGTDTIFAGYEYRLEEGVNLIIDTASTFKMIGTAHKIFKLGFLIRFGHGTYVTRVGLWTYYCQDNIIGYESFDKKGRTIGEVELYDNGQVKRSNYRVNRRKSFEYSETFFQDGKPVKYPEDMEKWIKTKEKNCAQQRI